MGKLSYEDKINLYNDKKFGMSISSISNNELVRPVAIDKGLLSKEKLSNWIKKYKESGYNIAEQKRGRSSTKSKITKKKDNETDKEKI